MQTVRQSVAQAAAELMKRRREAEKEEKSARAAKIAAFEKAGGFALTIAQIRGAFAPPSDIASWEGRGRAEIAREEAEANRPKQVVEIAFPDGGKGPKDAEMRPLKWSALRKCWEGVMNLDDARKLARSLGGSVKDDADSLPLAAE